MLKDSYNLYKTIDEDLKLMTWKFLTFRNYTEVASVYCSARGSRCREQNTAHSMGSALVSKPAAAGAGYAYDSLTGLCGLDPSEPALLRL
ncbi:hypothetical protein RR48_03939 [Papilio machaon]|uniref:Uncharacterized protein n=1 Tax=Papilio machaon TaxID=76193 RepID=A0A0N1PHV7_PAPMA|nr:hypothetical protein RR48_03939 [Papilio machaon]